MEKVIEGKKARQYDSRKKTDRHKAVDKLIIKHFKAGKVADFACGPGNSIELLVDKADEIYGIDVSSEMIKICKEKFAKKKHIHFKEESITKTTLKSDYFDYVIIRKGLHHVKEKKEVMKEIYRVLKPKGKIIFIEKIYKSQLLYKLLKSIGKEHFLSKDYERLLSDFRIIYKEQARNTFTNITIFELLEKT